jgi:hypothetical protein
MGCLLLLSAGLTGGQKLFEKKGEQDLETDPAFSAYRPDQLVRLKVLANSIFGLERQQKYGEIYDDWVSQSFKKRVSRRQFLILTNCLEEHLGPLEEFDSTDFGFKHQSHQGQSYEVLQRKITRNGNDLSQRLVITMDALDYKLDGLTWLTNHEGFLNCVKHPADSLTAKPMQPPAKGKPNPASR